MYVALMRSFAERASPRRKLTGESFHAFLATSIISRLAMTERARRGRASEDRAAAASEFETRVNYLCN